MVYSNTVALNTEISPSIGPSERNQTKNYLKTFSDASETRKAPGRSKSTVWWPGTATEKNQ